jgi:hypothetical protein
VILVRSQRGSNSTGRVAKTQRLIGIYRPTVRTSPSISTLSYQYIYVSYWFQFDTQLSIQIDTYFDSCISTDRTVLPTRGIAGSAAIRAPMPPRPPVDDRALCGLEVTSTNEENPCALQLGT